MTTFDKLKEQVDLYNKYMDNNMEFMEIDPDYYALLIDGQEITQGDAYDIFERVRDINRENGLNFFL